MDENPEYYEASEEYLEKSVRLKGAAPEAHLKLAQIYAQLGKIKEAKKQAEKAIKKGIQGGALKEARAILDMQ